MLAAAARAAGCSQRVCAAAAGVSASRWAAWESLTHDHTISLHRLLMAGESRPRLLAELGRRLVSMGERAADNAGRALAILTREQGELAAVYLEITADGQITPDERKRLAREAADVEAAAAAIRRWAEESDGTE